MCRDYAGMDPRISSAFCASAASKVCSECTQCVDTPAVPADKTQYASWTADTTGFNVTDDSEWTDYYRSPLPPPVGNGVLKALKLLQAELKATPPCTGDRDKWSITLKQVGSPRMCRDYAGMDPRISSAFCA